jgi:hypothetical protein
MSGSVIIAQLISDDTAQAGDIVVRSRSPVFALCRALLAAGADPNSKLECFRGSVLALTVKTIGIGAKLTIKENDWVGPKVVRYEPLSRDRVGRHVRQNGEPVDDHHVHARWRARAGGITNISDEPLVGIGRSGLEAAPAHSSHSPPVRRQGSTRQPCRVGIRADRSIG